MRPPSRGAAGHSWVQEQILPLDRKQRWRAAEHRFLEREAPRNRGTSLAGYLATDAVIGKFQLISYAVTFSTDGHIRDVEILSYREAHGGEVRSKAWRAQFVGKDATAALAIDNDIANISGATMSCTHLTDGIRRIAHYVRIALPKP